MPPVIRKQSRTADGKMRFSGLQMQNPVNICPMCKKVVPELFVHTRGQVKIRLCGNCERKF